MDFETWTFIGCLLLASQNDKLHGLAFWNSQGQLTQQTTSTIYKKKYGISEKGDEADWCFLESFIDLCGTSVGFVTLWGHFTCSSHFHIYFCHFNDEHVCHFDHSTGQLKWCLSFAGPMSHNVTVKGRAIFTTMGFQRSQRIRSFSQKVFFHLQRVWDDRTVICSCRAALERESKVIKFEEQFFNHGHKGLYTLSMC